MDRAALDQLIADAERHVESATAKEREAAAAAETADAQLRDMRMREAEMYRSAVALQERTLLLLQRLRDDPELI